MKKYYFVDGIEYSKKFIPNEVINHFEYKNSMYKLKKVGFIFTNNKLFVFLPKNTNQSKISSNENNMLFKALTKFSHLLNNNSSNIHNDIEIEKNDLFSVIDWLITDYIHNGIIKNNISRETRLNIGKINWDKTLKKITPINNSNGPIYLKFIHNQKILNYNFLSKVQQMVLTDISNKFGDLWNFKYYNRSRIQSMSAENIQFLIKELQSMLKLTNVIQQKILIICLLYYLYKISNGESNWSVITPNFDKIFEKAIQKYFGHNNTLMSYVPKAKWDIPLVSNKKLVNRQIPDVLVNNFGSLDIYDAKYYTLNSTTNNPPLDWYSVVKQFFYALSFDYSSSNLKFGNNYFVFPKWPMDNFTESIGNVHINLPKIQNNQLKINVIYINTFKILNLL